MILWNFIWKLHIQTPVKQLRWSLFEEKLEEVVRTFLPLGLHKRILESPCFLILFIYTKKKTQNEILESPRVFIYTKQRQQDEILESPCVFVSLSNNSDEKIKNLSTRQIRVTRVTNCP